MATRQKFYKIASVLLLGLLVVYNLIILFLPLKMEQFELLGYLGIFFVTLLGAMTVFIPGPTMVITFLMAAKLDPLLISLVAGAGSAIGETTGYVAGRASIGIIKPIGENNKYVQKISIWMGKYPFLTLFVISAIPNPFTDVAGIYAGRTSYSYPKFLFATFLGKVIRFGLSAFLGKSMKVINNTPNNWRFF